MTWVDFVCLKWQFKSHLNMGGYHATVRTAEKGGHKFGVCYHVPTEECKWEHPHARCYEHYMVDGVTYKSRKKLEEALERL